MRKVGYIVLTELELERDLKWGGLKYLELLDYLVSFVTGFISR